MSDASSPEAAVRRYLQWLEDPDSLIDDEAVARAEATVAEAADPLARLHALADLEHARQADSGRVTGDFVTHALAYSEAESIPIEAFRALGVPDAVLKEAGFGIGVRRGGRRASAPRSRAPQVTIEELKAATQRLPKQFTLANVAEEAGGGSTQTVRKAVDELVDAGRARKIGPKPDHHGRGRAPTLYELV